MKFLNIFIDHDGDGHKHYRIAITLILYNHYECLRRKCDKKSSFIIIDFLNELSDLINRFEHCIAEVKT